MPTRAINIYACARRLPAAALLLLVMIQSSAYAQSTQPAAPAPSVYDGQPIKRTSSEASTKSATPVSSTFDWQRLLIAMVLVLGLIALLRYFMVKLFPGTRGSPSTSAVRVLARASLAPRQQVLLVQVGRRVVVVGDSAGHLTSLSQIDDPDEVAALLGQVESTQAPTPAERFGSVFSRQRKTFDTDPLTAGATQLEPAAPEPQMQNVQSEVSGLIERMKSLTKSMKP